MIFISSLLHQEFSGFQGFRSLVATLISLRHINSRDINMHLIITSDGIHMGIRFLRCEKRHSKLSTDFPEKLNIQLNRIFVHQIL